MTGLVVFLFCDEHTGGRLDGRGQHASDNVTVIVSLIFFTPVCLSNLILTERCSHSA